MTTRSENLTHPGRRRLEQYAFDRTAQSRISEADIAHIEGCSVCCEYVEELRVQRTRFLAARPSERFLGQMEERMGESGFLSRLSGWICPRSSARRVVPVAAAALAVVLGIAVYSLPRSEEGVETKLNLDNCVVVRGSGLSFHLYVSRNGEAAHPADPDEPMRGGDVLRFGVRSDTPGYVYIANLDDRGRTSMYDPLQGASPKHVAAGARTVLDESIALDEFIGEELIVAVVSETKLAPKTVLDALTAAYAAAGGSIQRIDDIDIDGRVAFHRIRKIAP